MIHCFTAGRCPPLTLQPHAISLTSVDASRGSVMSIHCDTGYMFEQSQTASVTVWTYEAKCGDDLEWNGVDVIPPCISRYFFKDSKCSKTLTYHVSSFLASFINVC